VLFTTGYARDVVLADHPAQANLPWLLKPYARNDLTRQLVLLFGRDA